MAGVDDLLKTLKYIKRARNYVVDSANDIYQESENIVKEIFINKDPSKMNDLREKLKSCFKSLEVVSEYFQLRNQVGKDVQEETNMSLDDSQYIGCEEVEVVPSLLVQPRSCSSGSTSLDQPCYNSRQQPFDRGIRDLSDEISISEVDLETEDVARSNDVSIGGTRGLMPVKSNLKMQESDLNSNNKTSKPKSSFGKTVLKTSKTIVKCERKDATEVQCQKLQNEQVMKDVPPTQSSVTNNDVISISTVSSLCQRNKLKAGDKLNILVSHAVCPDEIYIQEISQHAAEMDRMHEQMLKVYGHTSRPSLTTQVGDLVAVYSKKERQWIRGQILSCENDGKEKKYVAFLFDFGDTITVLQKYCADLLPLFTTQPAFVIRICLANVCPVPPHKKWSTEVKQELQNILRKTQRMKLCVVTAPEDTNMPPTAVLSLMAGEEEVIVNELLISKGLASAHVLDETENQENMSNNNLDLWDPMAEDYHTGYIDDGDINRVVTGYNPNDEKRICYLYMKTGKCDRIHCRKEHVPLNPDGWTNDKESLYFSTFTTLELPSEGEICSFRVTALNSVNNMFGIISNKSKDGMNSIEELVEHINSTQHRTDVLNVLPSVGQIVLAMQGGQNFFYRARVLELRDTNNSQENFVEVFFVDYGNTEWVEINNIRSIEPKFLHLPFQAVEFCLKDICAKPDCIGEAMDKLMNVVSNNEIYVQVISASVVMNNMCTINACHAHVQGELLLESLGDLVYMPAMQSQLPAMNIALFPC